MSHEGREREIKEIVTYLRAAQVGRVFLGEANGKMTPVFPEMMETWSRPKIRNERERIRSYLGGEVKKFCRINFPRLNPLNFAEMYERLFSNGGHLELPLPEFQIFAKGDLRGTIFRGAPLHSTVVISAYWGLKLEFPEYHLMNDLAFAYNEMRSQEMYMSKLKKLPWLEKKAREREIADCMLRSKAFGRMCLLACFNLIEAYVNGLAWEHAHSHPLDKLTRKQREMIEGGSGSVLNRIIVIPEIVSGKDSPLDAKQYPLKEFDETVKPYRNSIVHASPFTSPDKFGGYDRLEKLYTLEAETVTLAIKVVQDLISAIHKHVDGQGDLPRWYYPRKNNGLFDFGSKSGYPTAKKDKDR